MIRSQIIKFDPGTIPAKDYLGYDTYINKTVLIKKRGDRLLFYLPL